MLRFRTLSLRARLMVIGVAGLALALAAGGLVLYGVLAYATDRTLANEAAATAADVSRLVDEGTLPNPIPVSGAQVVQVVDGRDRVVAASINADRLIPLLRPAELTRALGGTAVTVDGARTGLAGPLRVTAEAAGPVNARVSVIVALVVGDVANGQTTLRTTLLISYPLLIVVLALIAWRVIGSTLRPVEALRAGAERISGAGREERLPVPESTDEIRALAETLNGMLDRLAAARGRQRTFVADAAHELRSPLASIRTQLEVADHLGEGGTLPRELLQDVHRLAALVEDLLLLARADADTPTAARASVFHPAQLVAEVAAAYSSARVPVRVGAADDGQVSADRGELRRALANLVDNAVRHAASRVLINARVDGGQVLIEVTDDGPGIAPQDRDRVFERFTRLDDARDRDAGGSGLGLPIVRELVRRSGGVVRLDTAEPTGLVTTMCLPRV